MTVLFFYGDFGDVGDFGDFTREPVLPGLKILCWRSLGHGYWTSGHCAPHQQVSTTKTVDVTVMPVVKVAKKVIVAMIQDLKLNMLITRYGNTYHIIQTLHLS